jgi:hypothetical protein
MTEDALAHLRTNVLNPLHAYQVKLDAMIRAGDEKVAKLLQEHDQLTQSVDLVNQRKDDLNDEIRKIRQAMTVLENQKKFVARLLQRYHLQPTPQPPPINWQEGTLQECRQALSRRLKVRTLDEESLGHTSIEDKLRVYQEMDAGGYAVNDNCPEEYKRPDKVQLVGVTNYKRNLGLFNKALLGLVCLDKKGKCTAEE